MRLVDNDQIKSSRCESLILCIYVIDHGLIGTEHQSRIVVLLVTARKFANTHIGKQFVEIHLCLMNKRGSVCKEQDIFYPIVAGKYIYQCNRDTGLACACSHNKQTATVLLIEPLAKIRDRHALIRTTGNSRINFRVSDVATISSLQHELQFINRMERHDRSVRIQTVNDFCRVAVRIIQYGLISVNRFHAVAVKIHLMASFFRGYTCLFGFDYGKWFAVSAIEDIVA